MIFVFDRELNVIHNTSNPEDLISGEIIEQINGEHSCTITVPWNNMTQELYKEFNHVGFMLDGRFMVYTIRQLFDIKDGSADREIYCEHLSYELAGDIVEDRRVDNGTAYDIISRILSGTTWRVGNIAGLGNKTYNAYYISHRTALYKIAELYGGELQFRIELSEDKSRIENKYVDLLARRGEDTGIRFTFDNNLKKIEREVDTLEVYTQLIGRGYSPQTEDGGQQRRIQFTDVVWSKAKGDPADKPAGQNWIGHPEATKKYGIIKGVYEDESETPEELLLNTWNSLVARANPTYTYKAELAFVKGLMNEGGMLRLGDHFVIIDDELGLELNTRIIEIKYNLLDLDSSTVTMGQFYKLVGDKSDIEKLQSQIDNIRDKVNNTDTSIDDTSFPDVLPSIPVPTVTSRFATIQIDWTYENKSYFEYALYGSRTKGFTPSNQNMLFRGQASSFLHSVQPEETWYYRLCAYNTHGNRTGYTNEFTGRSFKISEASDYLETASVGSALIGSLNADVINAGALKGQHMDMKNVTVTDGNGDRTFHVDSFGRVHINATSFHLTGKDTNLADKDYVDSAIDGVSIGNTHVILSNESQVIATTNNRAPFANQTFTTKVNVYQGSKEITDFTIGNISGANGISVSVDQTNKTVKFTVSTSTTLTADNGSFTIPIIANGLTISKRWAWAVSKQGNTGATGATGPAGQDAPHIVVTGEQVFKYASNFSDTPTPANITLTATKINTTATGKWQWLDGSTWTDWSSNASTLNATTLFVLPTAGSLSTGKSIRIRYIAGSVYDEITIVKVSDGANGANGANGTDGTNGADAYTVILTNETHTFPTQNSGNIPAVLSTTTQILAYKGASSVTPAIGTLPNVAGLTLSKSGTTVTIQANTGTSLADAGSFNIPVIVDGKPFTKTFSWSKAKQGSTGATGATGATGPAGQNASHVVVTGEQVFKYANNFSGTPTPATITLTATKINTTATGKWQWLNGSTWTDWTSGGSTVTATTLSVWPTSGSLDAGKSIRVRYIVGSVYDEITIVKVSDGINGTNGTNGTNGADAYTIVLTNETHTFPTQNNGNIPTALSTTTQVMAYKGASSITPTIGTLPSVTGLTLSKSGTTIAIQANTGTSLADAGSFNIPITVDGKSFTKTFSWSKSKQGNTGATGSAGQNASHVVVTGEQIFKYTSNFSGTPTPANIILTATKINTTATGKWQWLDGSTWTDWTSHTSTLNATTLSVSPTAGSLSTGKSMRIRYIVGSVYDEITIVKVSDGANGTNGTNGANGANGADAYTVILTNETHTFPTQNNGNISTALSTTTQVMAYKGATSVTPTIGTLPSVAGLTLSKSGATITIKANTGTSLADSGSFNIPVTVDGKSFTKTFSWSKSKQGGTGATGATGATGPAGANAKAVDIIASSQVFKSTDGGTTFSPDTITLTPKLQSVNYSNWQYSTNGGSSWATVTSGQNGLSISGNILSISKSSPLFTKTVTTVVFRVNTSDSSVYDTISIVKLYDVVDLEVGGRNYIKYGKGDKKSGFFQHFTTVANGYGEHTLTSKKTFANVNIAPGFILGCRDYEVGRKVTFSYEIMFTKWDFPSGTNRSEWWIGQRYTNSSTSTDGQWRGVTTHTLPVVGENGCELNKWFKVTKILTIPAQAHSSIGTASSIQFYNSNESISASVTFRIRNVKIEYGNKATDWSPSPEEVKDDANQSAQDAVNAQTQLSIFNKLTNNGQTQGIYLENGKVYINGEYIKAGSVHADRIKTGTLTANMITSGTFKGVNFEAGGSGTAGVMLVKDASNNITFTASKNGINTKRISFVDTLKNDGTFVTSASTILTSSGYVYSRSESSSSYTATDKLSFVGTTVTSQSAINRTDGSNATDTTTLGPSSVIVNRTTTEKGSNAGNVTIAPLSLTLTTKIYGETNTSSCMVDMYNNQFRIRIGGSGTASSKGFAIHGPGDKRLAEFTSVGSLEVGSANNDEKNLALNVTGKRVGLYLNTTNFGIHDWVNNRNIMRYNVANDTLVIREKPLMYAVTANGYAGMSADGNTSGWVRTTANGIIPYQTANSSWDSANSSLGTGSWRFANGYIKEVYCNGLKNDLGDLWLSSKPNDSNASIYIQSKWLCPSSSVYTYLGSSGYRWHSVWASNGTIQTSDERFKVKRGFANIDDCFDMIKNTELYKYVMLDQNKEDLSRNRLGKLAMEGSEDDARVHMGIMAQDLQKYECGKHILVEGEYDRADGTKDTMLHVNPYDMTMAVMGGLKKEIEIREEQIRSLEARVAKLESLLGSIIENGGNTHERAGLNRGY